MVGGFAALAAAGKVYGVVVGQVDSAVVGLAGSLEDMDCTYARVARTDPVDHMGIDKTCSRGPVIYQENR